MADLAKIVEDLSALTVLEAAELSKLLEEKWGVSAAAPVAMAAPAAGGGAPAEAAEEQTEFTVVLVDGGDKKINVIKEVRGVRSDLGLKEAKDLVEGAPQNVVENVSKQNADEVAKKLTEAGAKVQILGAIPGDLRGEVVKRVEAGEDERLARRGPAATGGEQWCQEQRCQPDGPISSHESQPQLSIMGAVQCLARVVKVECFGW